MEDFIPEKKLKNSICSISKTNAKKIFSQMENCICKIDLDGASGTGFFCKINYPQQNSNNFIPILVTNNHVLSSNKLKKNDIICITLNGKSKTIKLDNDRIIFTSKKIDATFVEIKSNDNIESIINTKLKEDDRKLFLEIDEDILNEDYATIKVKYKNTSIYILHYENKDEVSVSYGLLNAVTDKYFINHCCNTSNGSSGAPILNLNNFKLIGIHCGAHKNFNFNKGILFKEAINNFFERNKKKEFKIIFKRFHGGMDVIFGREFIENNKDKCKICYKGEEFGLEDLNKIKIESINISSKNSANGTESFQTEIILKEIKKMTNMSYLFNGYCLSSIDFPNWDTSNITDMNNMFYECGSLPDISKWDTSNVINMSNMFYYCSLESFPDISKWDTSNVLDMNNMFYECGSLPDISKWDTSCVKNMSNMFHCVRLESLPDISRWNTSNVINMSNLFSKIPV